MTDLPTRVRFLMSAIVRARIDMGLSIEDRHLIQAFMEAGFTRAEIESYFAEIATLPEGANYEHSCQEERRQA